MRSRLQENDDCAGESPEQSIKSDRKARTIDQVGQEGPHDRSRLTAQHASISLNRGQESLALQQKVKTTKTIR